MATISVIGLVLIAICIGVIASTYVWDFLKYRRVQKKIEDAIYQAIASKPKQVKYFNSRDKEQKLTSYEEKLLVVAHA